MKSLTYAGWLGSQALSGIIHYWPITLLLLAFVITSGLFAARKHSLNRGKNYLFLFIPFLSSPVLWLLGSNFQEQPQYLKVIQATFVAFSAASIIPIVFAKPARLFVTAVVLLLLWLGLWSAFVAGMSVTDDWL
jgi:hypothetical protein